MSYIIPSEHRCNLCGFEMMYSPDLSSTLVHGSGPDRFVACPQCLMRWLKSHIGEMVRLPHRPPEDPGT